MTQTILIVDDSAVIQKLVEFQLSKAGYNILIASNGLEGVKMAQQHEPDLIIMDVQMPEMDGYEASRLIRESRTTKNIPIIMLTSLSTIQSMQKGYDAGVDDYLTKPFQSHELILRVEAMLRRFKRAQDSAQKNEAPVIAVFSLRGGAGCTSLATNLGVGLAKLWGKTAVLIDLAMPIGACDVALNISSKYNLSYVLNYDLDSIDDKLIYDLLTTHESGLKLLSGLRDPVDAELLSENMASFIIDSLSERAFYTVIDLPHDFGPTSLAAIDKADQIIMPITPDVVSVREAVACLRIFKSLGIKEERIQIIINWVMAQGGLSKEVIEKHLGHKVLLTIPHVRGLWSEAINLGTPLLMSKHDHPVVGLLEDLCWQFSTQSDRSQQDGAHTKMWHSITNRQMKRRMDKKGKAKKFRLFGDKTDK